MIITGTIITAAINPNPNGKESEDEATENIAPKKQENQKQRNPPTKPGSKHLEKNHMNRMPGSGFNS